MAPVQIAATGVRKVGLTFAQRGRGRQAAVAGEGEDHALHTEVIRPGRAQVLADRDADKERELQPGRQHRIRGPEEHAFQLLGRGLVHAGDRQHEGDQHGVAEHGGRATTDRTIDRGTL